MDFPVPDDLVGGQHRECLRVGVPAQVAVDALEPREPAHRMVSDPPDLHAWATEFAPELIKLGGVILDIQDGRHILRVGAEQGEGCVRVVSSDRRDGRLVESLRPGEEARESSKCSTL